MQTHLLQQKRNNVFKTWFLMIFITVLLVLVGSLLADRFQNPSILNGFMIFAMIQNIVAFWFSDKIALASNNAKPLDRAQYPVFQRVAERIAQKTNMPLPRLYVIHDGAPNAFATGRNQKHAAIAATTGILELLSEEELEGVIAHEFGHIQNKDILINTVAGVLIGFILMMLHTLAYSQNRNEEGGTGRALVLGLIVSLLGPIVAQLIQLAISRKREFLADATGALTTNHPEHLASALQKISAYARPMKHVDPATSHLFIANPSGKIKTLFMSHPPVEERVKALLEK